MFWHRFIIITLIVFTYPILSGCGISPPDIKEVWDGPYGTEQIEFEIKKRVYCDLRKAVASAETIPFFVENRQTHKKNQIPIIPKDWGAQISLLLQVDESTNLNPGVAITGPLASATSHFSTGNVTTAQSYSFGLGANLSSTATRIDKFDPYYPIDYLLRPETKDSVCIDANDPFLKNNEIPSSSSLLITSDLGLEKWLHDAMFVNAALHSVDPTKSTNKDVPDTVSIEIKFMITTSSNINPVYKLVRIGANNGSSPLLATGRIRTHDLLITIGPENLKTTNTNLAGQIGQIINSGRSGVPTL